MPNTNVALVYVIEQDEAVRDSLKALIESNGFSVRDFANKEKFLSNTEPGAGNCLVLGFNRYGADAIKNLRYLRKNRPNLPIIFVVGQGGASSRALAGEAAFAQLDRPIKEATLIQAIRRAIGH